MADTFIRNCIRDDKVTLFIKSGCSYSRNALDLLKSFTFVPGGLQVVDITAREDVQNYFKQRMGQTSTPHVFIGKHCVGGFSDLQSVCCDLPRMLRQIGALR
ncbi:glutaredoxin-1-like [Grus americana]|uniref:glutaredoxin-1-like n=1 Tax=Grus americana TaxID=9117 RepID=UPI002407C061|nr:glutaredoxin-1-like [Grus americana]